jgi:hypothetical protein
MNERKVNGEWGMGNGSIRRISRNVPVAYKRPLPEYQDNKGVLRGLLTTFNLMSGIWLTFFLLREGNYQVKVRRQPFLNRGKERLLGFPPSFVFTN